LIHGKVDQNHQEIVAVLRQVGVTVQDLSQVGKGCPDIVCGWKGKNYFFEIKTEKGKLSNKQKEWFRYWNGHKAVIRNEYDAFEEMGIAQDELATRYSGI